MTTTLIVPSRRTLLAGLAASPALTAAAASAVAQTPTAKTAAEQAQTALKDARGTKLVLPGTGAGPGSQTRKRAMAGQIPFTATIGSRRIENQVESLENRDPHVIAKLIISTPTIGTCNWVGSNFAPLSAEVQW